MQSKFSEGVSGEWDDFVGTVGATGTSTTGKLNWTVTIGASAPTVAASSAAIQALMQGLGGVSFTGSTGQLLSQLQLANAIINPNSTTGLLGIEMEANVMFDTALPAATPSYSFLFGMADGTTSASNFVGLHVGWNPVVNGSELRFALANDTIAHLIGNTAASPSVPFGLPIALDVVQSIKLRISPDWKTIQGFANGVSAPVMAVGAPYGGSTSVPLPVGTAYKPTFGANCNVATMTGVVAVDYVELSPIGRPTRG
jgi:hypothetical protein